MAQATILICDGCEKPTTTRRPVNEYQLTLLESENHTLIMKGDAHDWNCFGRIISRRRKAERAERAAAKAKTPKKAKK